MPTQCSHLTQCGAGSHEFSPVQPVQFLSCTTVESASTTHLRVLLELNKHPTNHSSWLYLRLLCLCMYDDFKAIHEEAWMPFSESLEYIVLSSWTLLPGLFRISVVRMFWVFFLWCTWCISVLSVLALFIGNDFHFYNSPLNGHLLSWPTFKTWDQWFFSWPIK